MKGKGGNGGVVAPRYRPASEFDDATLAQKREYWRTKKREQRARLSRRKETFNRRREGNVQHLDVSAVLNSSLSSTSTSPLQGKRETNVSQSVTGAGESVAVEANSHRQKWFKTLKLNNVLPRSPASGPIANKTTGGSNVAVKRLSTWGAVSKSFTSVKSSGARFANSSSVPPLSVSVPPSGTAPGKAQLGMAMTNGGSSKTTPQPRVAMQGNPVPKAQCTAQVVVCIQPRTVTANVTTKMSASSSLAPGPLKVEDRPGKATPTIVQKSASLAILGNKGTDGTQTAPKSEEEKLAKRREQWRIKKREQRAKQAARLKSRERTPQTRPMPQRTGYNNGVVKPLPSAISFRAVSQQPCVTRFKAQLASGRRLPSNPRVIIASPPITQQSSVAVKKEMADFVPTNLVHSNQRRQAVKLKVDYPHMERSTQTATTSGAMIEKKPGELTRKLYTHFSNASRGMVRCRTPRQRFIETQRSFLGHRNTGRGKFSLQATVFNTRNIPKPDPNETPEQTAARRREYWRIKKREQRAKLSAEVKNKLKEKDSMMRRVKRYQNILEEMRRARAMSCSTVTQQTGGSLSHAPEVIGGFIKEDGTVTINIPPNPTVAANAVKEEADRLPVNNIFTHPHNSLQSKPGGSGSVVNVPLNSPLLRPSQVKVSFPIAGRSVNRPRRLVSVKPRVPVERTKSGSSSHTLAIQNPTQITLAHPQGLRNATPGRSAARPGLGGCVMKMAVLNPEPAAAGSGQLHPLDPKVREEERMVKKREYWRIKKREQRAARDARLRQGLMLARSNAATLQRRKNQKLGLVNNVTPSRDGITNTVSIGVPNSSVANTPQIVQEGREPIKCEPVADTCPDIKPPLSPGPQPDPDPALSAESQATTLLAVASMKKLLEESLSTVTECKTEQEDTNPPEICCKSEVEQEIKTNTPLSTDLLVVKNELPVTADLTLEIKSWQIQTGDALAIGLNDSPQTCKTLPPLPCTSASPPPPSTSMEMSDCQSSPPSCRFQRSCVKVEHREICPPEPPKLHHLPLDGQTQHCERQCQTQQQSRRQTPPLAPQQARRPAAADEQNHMTSLQKKREYWKLMKRQQRARSKARQKDGGRHGDHSRRLYPKTLQVSDVLVNSVKRAQVMSPPSKPVLHLKPSTFTSAGVHNIPTVLIVSPTASTVGRSPDTLQVKPPITSVGLPPVQKQEEKNVVKPVSAVGSNLTSASRTATRLLLAQQAAPPAPHAGHAVGKKWPRQAQHIAELEDMAPALPTLTPPENPLSSINLQPIEAPGCAATFAPLKILCVRPQNPEDARPSATKLTPISTMAPPKRFAGESEDSFLIRKREYWRVKKKEQRARKAIRDRDLTQKRGSGNWRPLLPAQGLLRDLDIQDPGQWVNSSDESEHLMSASAEAEVDYFPFPSYTMPIEDDSDMLFDDGVKDGEDRDGCVSDAAWRSRYLMDHDPLNQLLVCMVCGDLQYSHCLEAVRAHIEEAHPETLRLEAPERRRILEAWDEQVSRRERFFTSQLQQQSGPLAGAHRS